MAKTKAKLFNPRLLPMDLARVVIACLTPAFRLRRLTPTGEKYRGKIRGNAIVAANHNGFSDPMVLLCSFWYRRVFFLVGEAVMQGKLRRALIRSAGGIEINRNIADMQAIRKSVEVLKQGHMVSLFPEGQITRDESVTAIKSGAVLMALQGDAPIIPVHIHPREKWYRRRKVVIGQPIYPREICQKKFPSTADIQKITDILAEEMNKCVLPREGRQEVIP